MKRGPLVIVGASTRSAAASALRAGFEPWCVDLFADRDLEAMAPVKRCPGEQWPRGVLALMSDAPSGPILLTGAMENHLEVVEALLKDRNTLGSSAQAMAQARRPRILAELAPHAGLGHCEVGERGVSAVRSVVKPYRSAAGMRIAFHRPGEPVDEDCYLQQYIEGESIAAAFHGDGQEAVLLGVTRQLLDGFRYVGSVGPLALDGAVLRHVGHELVRRCGLRGPFGVDAIVDRAGVIWPVEVNPRYTASMEIIERVHGASALEPFRESRYFGYAGGDMLGKRIVFARVPYVAPDLYAAFAQEEIADIPHIGELIHAGRPICTVFATGPSVESCEQRLRLAAEKVYTQAVS